MENNDHLEKILLQFRSKKVAQVKGYKSFGYIRETKSAVYVTREDGEDTPIPFKKILVGVEAYKNNPDLYDDGPTELRQFGITHVTSPIWSILHLLSKKDYKKVE